MGTIATTLGALALAVPLGIGTAIVIAELAPDKIRYTLQMMVRLLASIPSVIYGLVGLWIIVPFIQTSLISSDMQIKYLSRFQLSGNSMLAGILVLSIMIIPIIITLSVDAIRAVPSRYKEASLALGLTSWRTIVKVILPAAKSGIYAGIILGMGRAMGEAIALSMVSGGIGNIPKISDGSIFFLTPVLTLASAIVNKSELMSVPSIESALFACGLILLLTSVLISFCAQFVQYLVMRGEGRA
jgi:phosphate transport system permease protein